MSVWGLSPVRDKNTLQVTRSARFASVDIADLPCMRVMGVAPADVRNCIPNEQAGREWQTCIL